MSKAATAAAKVLKDPKASKDAKVAAASALTQRTSKIETAVRTTLEGRTNRVLMPHEIADLILHRDVVAVARFVRNRQFDKNAPKAVREAADRIVRSDMPVMLRRLAASALTMSAPVAPAPRTRASRTKVTS